MSQHLHPSRKQWQRGLSPVLLRLALPALALPLASPLTISPPVLLTGCIPITLPLAAPLALNPTLSPPLTLPSGISLPARVPLTLAPRLPTVLATGVPFANRVSLPVTADAALAACTTLCRTIGFLLFALLLLLGSRCPVLLSLAVPLLSRVDGAPLRVCPGLKAWWWNWVMKRSFLWCWNWPGG